MYPLLGLLATMSLIFFVEEMKQTKTKRLYGLFLINAALLWTHYFGVFVVFFEFIVSLIKPGHRSRPSWMVFYAGLFLILSLWLIPNLCLATRTYSSHLSALTPARLPALFWLSSPLPSVLDRIGEARF